MPMRLAQIRQRRPGNRGLRSRWPALLAATTLLTATVCGVTGCALPGVGPSYRFEPVPEANAIPGQDDGASDVVDAAGPADHTVLETSEDQAATAVALEPGEMGRDAGIPGARGDAFEPGEVVPIGSLLPPRSRSGLYRRTIVGGNGEDFEQVVAYRLQPGETDGNWRMKLGAVREALLGRTEAGATVIRQERDASAEVCIVYREPATLIPAESIVGQITRFSTPVDIYDLDTGELKHRGACEIAIQLRGWREVETPAGRFGVWQIDAIRRIRVFPVEIELRVDSAFSPRHGLVDQRIRRRMRTLGIAGREYEERLQLLATGDATRQGKLDPPGLAFTVGRDDVAGLEQ